MMICVVMLMTMYCHQHQWWCWNDDGNHLSSCSCSLRWWNVRNLNIKKSFKDKISQNRKSFWLSLDLHNVCPPEMAKCLPALFLCDPNTKPTHVIYLQIVVSRWSSHLLLLLRRGWRGGFCCLRRLIIIARLNYLYWTDLTFGNLKYIFVNLLIFVLDGLWITIVHATQNDEILPLPLGGSLVWWAVMTVLTNHHWNFLVVDQQEVKRGPLFKSYQNWRKICLSNFCLF